MSVQLEPHELVAVLDIEDTQRKLGQLIRINRRVRDLTLEGLGNVVGVHPGTISKFELYGYMSFELFMKSANALDLPGSALLKIAEDPGAFGSGSSLKSRLII